MPPSGIVQSIKTALEDYASFDSDEVEAAVLEGLKALDADLTENGYQQSTATDAAAVKIEDAMNAADNAEKDVEEDK